MYAFPFSESSFYVAFYVNLQHLYINLIKNINLSDCPIALTSLEEEIYINEIIIAGNDKYYFGYTFGSNLLLY